MAGRGDNGGPIGISDVVCGLRLLLAPHPRQAAPPTQGTAHTQGVPIALGPMLSCPSGLQAPFAPEADLETRIPVK